VETLVAAQEWQQDSPAQLADKEKEKEATMGDADRLRELMNDCWRWDGMQQRHSRQIPVVVVSARLRGAGD
jgi:hypothetical protein